MNEHLPEQPSREQKQESINALRFLGGMLLVLALLLYFFHLAEVPMGQSAIGVLAAASGALGVVLLWVGQHQLRKLQLRKLR
jgi:hypothetical protein